MAVPSEHPNNFRNIRKVAFRRACTLVSRTQQSIPYRRGILTPEYVDKSRLHPPTQLADGGSKQQTPAPKRTAPRSRGGALAKPLRVLTWNAGHLGQQQWAELRTWLRTAADKYDVIALQETHWQETTEFDVEGWHCVSSASKGQVKATRSKIKQNPTAEGTGPALPEVQAHALHDDKRADGVMILTAPHIPKDTVRWSEHKKGRVLETVFQWKGARVHVVSVYQHVWSTSKTAQQNRADRSTNLAALSRAIRGVPQRDTLIVLGDFNSTLTPSPGVVGPCTPGPPPHRKAEDEFFQRLVQGHGLVALNTWSSGKGFTFQTATTQSQLDYILVPKTISRGEAKKSTPLAHFQLGKWKKGGHLPVAAQIRPMRHWQLPPPPPPSPAIRQTCTRTRSTLPPP